MKKRFIFLCYTIALLLLGTFAPLRAQLAEEPMEEQPMIGELASVELHQRSTTTAWLPDSLEFRSKFLGNLQLSGYLEAYYSLNVQDPESPTQPGYLYSYNRNNEVNLNLGFVRIAYEDKRIKSNLAFMAGTYANANLAAEEGGLKNVFEANIGLKLHARRELWLEAGIMPSHIGFESAIGRDCWNLTRSLLAENSPYYESGVKLSYAPENEVWKASVLLLNGWQRIQRVPGNSLPSFGHQLMYTPSEKVAINSSSFIGTDSPDSARRMRYFHNFYTTAQISPKIGVTAGFDIGLQQSSKGSSDYNTWYSPVLIVQYKPSGKFSMATRTEYYSDKYGVIVSTSAMDGFQMMGFSINADYNVNENAVLRLEARNFRPWTNSLEPATTENMEPLLLTTSLAISLR